MGLSASSLRIAMLTARKSSLEFEGQQINQQRLTLSNQSAALFNSMLTMQVPTPPDPSEFSRMVYTFDKGSGLSTILNVGRNMSGGYTHDVLYKSPKTDSVLMKKQLNNVGFRFENNQMSAVIDGMNYNLTLNGNKEKLDEYLKTKETYDNIKDIETQMQTLWKMSPNKELTSSQMKQYFETLGLSPVETPQESTVLDVQNTDDAFQNVYNNGNAYSYQDVALTYNASTPPFTLDPSKQEKLKSSQGTLTMGSDNKHYTYTTQCSPSSTGTPDLQNSIIYNINQDNNGNWSWTLDNVSGDVLKKFGITYEKKLCTTQGNNLQPTASGVSLDDVNYSNFSYDSSTGTWSWDEPRTGQWFNQGSEYVDIQGKQSCQIGNKNYDIRTIGGTTYFYEQTSSPISYPDNVVEHWMEQGGKIGYDIDRNGKIDKNEFIDTSESTTRDDVEYSISKDEDNQWKLTVSSEKMFAAWKDSTECLTGIKDKEDWYRVPVFKGDNIGYWYNTQTDRVEIMNDAVNVDQNSTPKDGDNNWVWVSKVGNKWEYTISLSSIPQFEHNGKALSQDDNDNWYQDVDVKNDGKNDYQKVYTRDEQGTWSTQKRYTAEQLGGNIKTTKNETKTASELPIGILDDNRQIGIQYTYNNQQSSWSEENASVSLDRYTIQRNSSGKFNLSGTGLPNGVESRSASDGGSVEFNGSSNGVSYNVIHNGGNSYSITASFKAWVTGNSDTWNNDEQQNGYRYNPQSHSLTLTTPTGVIAQMLFRNDKNQRGENDKNITVGEMLDFYEAILNQFGLYGSTTAYKTKLDKARSDYLATLDAKGVENPGENQALFNFIDANGKTAYLFVPLDCINKNSQVDSTYAYMYETSYLDGQNETISQKANIVYDENGRIAKITFDDGTVVIPEVKVEQDEEAYNAAMVKYDYEKQLYDKEIQDINTKTEIIAQQDKNLEIKLKSIDTQHTAIQTELEALNKVLDNNVKSSFGTFTA